jgi:hypothetical protein
VTPKIGTMPKVFSRRTLEEFEAASASIPIRPLERVFERAHIRLGKDPGGPDGARRAQFRRYIASVDQLEPQELDRLGNALGALIEEVATAKQDFLVKAAERDGFSFAGGVFRPAATAPRSFAVKRSEDLALIEDRGRRLYLLANDSPTDAIAGANELVESVCRTVLRLIGEPAPGKTVHLAAIAKSALNALDPGPVAPCLQQLSDVVTSLGKLKSLSPRHARLAVGAAVTFSGFVAETYVERAAPKKLG